MMRERVRSSRRRVLLVLGLLLTALPVGRSAAAQELNCSVSVNYTQLSGSDYGYLQELEQLIYEYLNEYAWTEDTFREYERIDCSVQLFFLEAVTLTSFRARLVVASRRPIYGTAQSTTVVQLSDTDLQFTYARGTPLIHDIERYDPLTSVLDFYAYILLGMDYDTFSEMGGTPHFERARRIADIAQSQNAPGWTQLGGDRGRSNLISQLLDPRFRPVREAAFAYHFYGLDHFVANPDAARERVLDVLSRLESLQQELGRQYLLDLFFSAKAGELAALFLNSNLSSQAYDLLSVLDPSNLNQYSPLVN